MSRLGGAVKWVGRNPDISLNVIIVAAAAILSILDLTGGITLTQTGISRLAVALVGGLALATVTSNIKKDPVLKHEDDVLNSLQEGLKEVRTAMRSIQGTLDQNDIPAEDRTRALLELLSQADSWSFRGGSGRWQRSTVLPELSRRGGQNIPYRMQIVDPRNEALCTRYAQFRVIAQSPEVSRPNEGEVVTILSDLLACVYAVSWYSHNSMIQPVVSLMPFYTPFRIDGNPAAAVVTIADPTANALGVRRGNWYHRALLEELDRSEEEFPAIKIERSVALFPSQQDVITPSVVQDALKATRVTDETNESPLLQPWMDKYGDELFLLVSATLWAV
jgi:hypothetical protein